MKAVSRALRYGIAPLATAAALLLRMALQPYLRAEAQYSTFLLAILLSAVTGGLGPGILAVILSVLAVLYYLIPRVDSFALGSSDHALALALFVVVAGLTVALAESQRRARLRAEERQVELEKAEAAERRHREWLQVTLASIGDGVIVTSSEGRVVLLNAAAAALTRWRQEEAAGQPVEAVFDIRSEETGAGVDNPALIAIREGRVTGLANHTVLIARTGEQIPINDSGAPIVDASGKVFGAVLVFRDVSQQKAQQAELRRLHRLVNASHDAIIVADAGRRIQGWNAGAEEMYGFTAPEALGQAIHDLLKTRNSRRISEIDQILAAQGRWDGELIHTCKDGRTLILDSRHILLRGADGEVTGILEINRDITDRKRAEKSLRASRERLDLALDSADLGLWYSDLPPGALEMNELCKRHYGLPAGAEVTSETISSLIHPEDRERVAAAREKAIAEGVPFDAEYRTVGSDGVTRFVRAAGRAFSDGSEAPNRFDGVTLDITAQKRREESEREVQRLESLGLLAGGIAHDFNNLLTGVLGNASLLLDDLDENSRERGYVEGIARAAERAAQLTHQILAYSGRGRFVIQPVNMSQFIPETTALIQASIPKSVKLQLELAPDLPAVEADLAQLQQLVMNFVVNGAEAIGPEGGRVAVRTFVQQADEAYLRARRLEQRIAPGLYVALEVEDTGCGMDDATLARIFEPFFTTKFTGRGLGLAAVQGIVRGHNGAIEVASSKEGSTFRVLLPAQAAAAPAEPPRFEDSHKTPAAAPCEGAVLVIDDEEVVCATAGAALEKLGYLVVIARDGQEAVRVFRERPEEIRLVLLDMTMPGLSGEETLRHLRAVRADVPVVLSSGYSEAEALERFGGQALAGFLQKPYTTQALARKVSAATAELAPASSVNSRTIAESSPLSQPV